MIKSYIEKIRNKTIELIIEIQGRVKLNYLKQAIVLLRGLLVSMKKKVEWRRNKFRYGIKFKKEGLKKKYMLKKSSIVYEYKTLKYIYWKSGEYDDYETGLRPIRDSGEYSKEKLQSIAIEYKKVKEEIKKLENSSTYINEEKLLSIKRVLKWYDIEWPEVLDSLYVRDKGANTELRIFYWKSLLKNLEEEWELIYEITEVWYDGAKENIKIRLKTKGPIFLTIIIVLVILKMR